MARDSIQNEYFEWLYDSVYSGGVSFYKLLRYLHETEFIYSIPRDRNRAIDGMYLRYRFATDYDYPDINLYLEGPCSVLEMMVALSIRCEEDIMDDPSVGDRTSQWFWGMIVNMGLGSMYDERFDIHFVEDTITRFLNRDYEPNGEGGLFTIKYCDRDLRDVEIWYQLCWYLDEQGGY